MYHRDKERAHSPHRVLHLVILDWPWPHKCQQPDQRCGQHISSISEEGGSAHPSTQQPSQARPHTPCFRATSPVKRHKWQRLSAESTSFRCHCSSERGKLQRDLWDGGPYRHNGGTGFDTFIRWQEAGVVGRAYNQLSVLFYPRLPFHLLTTIPSPHTTSSTHRYPNTEHDLNTNTRLNTNTQLLCFFFAGDLFL